ncbi:MAG TPA: polyprenol monophosphomannose synthase [Chthoniobacterales bacterium]|nr:polyprenol monophosphomannose synthase [Chthoniobacterales bacterium]
MAESQLSHRISVVVPTLNEADNIAPLIEQIAAAAPDYAEIVIVDDGSDDGTPERVRELAERCRVNLIQRDKPALGLAGAVIAGARAAHGEIVVVMDADLSHPPDQIPNLVQPLREGRADMVIGSRYVRGGTTPGWPLARKIMSRLAAAAAYPLTGVHDSMCGFFAIRRNRLLELAPKATGFKIAFEAIARGHGSLRILEIPIAFRDRARGVSKMTLRIATLFAMRWLAVLSRRVFRHRR